MPFDCIQDTSHLKIAPRYPRIRTAIWDVETDGLLDKLTRVHCLVIRDFERRVTYRFRRNDVEDTIDDGLDLLEQAEISVGLNCVHFDIPALDKVYESIRMQGKVRDALVMSRMVFANQKEKDFRLFEKGKLPGKLIGSHTLKAWGYRLGLHKGDYMEVMEDRARDQGITDPDEIVKFVWGAWNQEMEDYCVNDVDVTTLLWDRILRAQWPEPATVLEHTIHDLMGQQERNGIYFNVEEAETLAADLEQQAHILEQLAIKHYGNWWVPEKKRIIRALWDDPDGINKSKTYEAPRPEYGEDTSRAIWGEVVEIKKTLKFKDPVRADRYEGALYCPVKCNEFNPNSRPQIIDRFVTVYKWHPVDFTEKGQPEVSDDVLRKLGDSIPMAHELAEVFYYNKRLGQLKTGPNALIKKTSDDGKIHAYVNVGGTISGRASHVSPNLGQVPRVVIKKGLGLLKGREGDHGWDFRNLFYIPPALVDLGWGLTGVDLEGIELRCFGERLAKYDNGAYLELVLSGDPHSYNQNLAGLPTRDMAKTFIYALLYGAGDIKLGSIVAPLADEEEQKAIGSRLRERFLAGFPAFGKLLKEVRGYAKAGFIPGLDGRRLYVRSPHSALNTWLQSDAALIAKEWVCRTENYLLDRGLEHSWDADFAFLLWVHDEIQIASRSLGGVVAECALQAAKDSGLHFGYKCPISASPKHGLTWAQTH